ncbi:MAG TPA: YciI family protein [Vicinamibacterales bacterium]|nr:YciI family protein [Vicinamibacterales bacterium]
MRFMMIVKADKNYEAGTPPPPELLAAIGKLSEEMVKAGVILDMGGLLPSSKGARINVKKGKLTVTDGPFSEAKELIGGYAILQVKSREEAIERGRRFMQIHADVLGPSYDGELEIRQMPEAPPCT